MVIVVEFFAANHDAPGEHVGTGIRACEVAVAPVVPHTIDHAGSPERNPCHLNSPDSEADRAKKRQVDRQHHQDAQRTVT